MVYRPLARYQPSVDQCEGACTSIRQPLRPCLYVSFITVKSVLIASQIQVSSLNVLQPAATESAMNAL